MTNIEQYIQFIKETEKLKSVLRTAYTSCGQQESTAEHSWRLSLFAAVLSDEFPGLDIQKTIVMCLVHDLGELYSGDISAVENPNPDVKFSNELSAVQSVTALLPETARKRILDIFLEYEQNETPEAKLVKALDKAETIIQHNQGDNPKDFNYHFNLQYGKEHFTQNELLTELRTLIDKDTVSSIEKSENR